MRRVGGVWLEDVTLQDAPRSSRPGCGGTAEGRCGRALRKECDLPNTYREDGSSARGSRRGHGARAEVDGANGRKALVALLSSPTARVNLMGKDTRGNTTASCQGMANKHASRALVNLLLPRHEIALALDALPEVWWGECGGEW